MASDFQIYFPKNRDEEGQIDLVPIIDAFVAIIFFLLLTTSFYKFSKLTLPPTKISYADPATDEVPKQVQVMVMSRAGDSVEVLARWGGKTQRSTRTIYSVDLNERKSIDEFEDKLREKLLLIKEKMPTEQSIQLGTGHKEAYQLIIALMDASVESFPDVILLSPDEVKKHFGEAG